MPGASVLPSGVVTFMLTDIEGSTALWDAHPQAMAAALEQHDALVGEIAAAHGGVLLKQKGEGDATVSVFQRASAAVAAAAVLQETIGATAWPGPIDLAIRVALHTGEAHERDGDFFGPTLNRAARLRGLIGGGQVVLSEATAALVLDHLPNAAELVDLGRRELRGLSRDERVFELRHGSFVAAASRDAAGRAEQVAFPASLAAAAGGLMVGRTSEFAALRQRLVITVRRYRATRPRSRWRRGSTPHPTSLRPRCGWRDRWWREPRRVTRSGPTTLCDARSAVPRPST